jgi:hypothetical protein
LVHNQFAPFQNSRLAVVADVLPMRLESHTSFDLLGLISLAEPDSPRSTHNLYNFRMPACRYHHHEHTSK